MLFSEYGNPAADTVLIQPVDEHELETIETEVALIREFTRADFRLIAARIENWNDALSPWRAPAVFGGEAFGGGAAETLAALLRCCPPPGKTCYIGGYSLAGLFALWAAYQTDRFQGVAAASPSVWFPGFTEYAAARQIRTGAVSLSLGDREERTRNPVTATVGEKIRALHASLQNAGVRSVLEWNPGNHFQEPDRRTAKAFAALGELK